MLPSTRRLALLALVLVLAAPAAGCSDSSGTPPPTDTDAPSVLATAPLDGAIGVLPDAVPTVTFSEPMDQASVEAAYGSEDLAAQHVSFVWSEDGTELTIVPEDLLMVAEGAGTTYAYAIGVGATDLAGNPLDETLVRSFTTAALEKVELAPVEGLSGTNFGGSSTNSTMMWVGDSAPDSEYAAVASFDLGGLPEETLGVAHATFGAFQNSVDGTPYADLGGAIAIHPVSFAALNVAGAATPGASLGTFSDSTELSERTAEVTDEVGYDFAHLDEQDGLSQFRLRFPTPTDEDGEFDYARFDVDAAALEVWVYVP